MRDEIFRNRERVQDFIFDENVATVFDDMLERSVPFYGEVQRMVVELAAQFLREDGTVYDVGCSTGNTLLGVASVIEPDRAVRFVGIEPSPGMREQAAKKLAAIPRAERVSVRPDAIEDVPSLPDARVITMLYTMQFVRPIHRPRVLAMFHDSLHRGGCLLMAEKILADDRELRRMFIDLYHAYKMRHGYTSTEISRKREALENVLIPFTEPENIRLMREAGFAAVERIFQWYNFAAYIAVKR
ncbi:carboxy-S-adenosyl-L-methionine synthase CmoA [Bailinhaonella thermotolerans]|uniref:Carboxy-S-adenosyl-L-methionine synthase n=1 Tax=Bailinhaonella thermotolerans TaxID=1070861 RepID=A0A3A4AN31_9ACTN|nr:carboxy-S-adenosyl-L-methionine synthase CmoA [Bailinhaonella thermotolerans]RJL27223.1 carboxy-S-adenosyl-L-methionine synthase CmoA [Bailinhaonella thermotolerans]